jgi:hypothetical protein
LLSRTYGRPCTIDTVCQFVTPFPERLPDYLCDHLLDIGDVREETQKADLARKRSYSAGAKLLLAVMNRRVREYQGEKIRT